jgi:hypothetical protein
MTTELQLQLKLQLRANRRHALGGWMDGGDGSPRWDGDDGRVLKLDEWQFWSDAIKAAEQARFDVLDAEYESAKTREGL